MPEATVGLGTLRAGYGGPVADHPVVPATASGDVGTLGALLARAFADDPVARFVMPSDRRRPPGLRSYFQGQLRTHRPPVGLALTTPERSGAAVWSAPGTLAPSSPWALWAALTSLPWLLGRHTGRALGFLRQVFELRPVEPHWYLAVLGTEPARQRRGIGSALLGPVLARCDAEGVPAYLESSKAANVPFYRRHGFEVTKELRQPGCPTIWTMGRRPRL